MKQFSPERKASVLSKLLPPNNQLVSEVSKLEGISEAALYNWRTQAKQQGIAVPGSGKTSNQWSADAKLAVVIETASINESSLSEYWNGNPISYLDYFQFQVSDLSASSQTLPVINNH